MNFAYAAKIAISSWVLLQISSPASASTWLRVAESQHGSTYDVDASSISADGQTRRFWVRVHYGPSTVKPGHSDGYTALRIANCSDMSYRDIQTSYTRNGEVTNVDSTDYQTFFASPDSVGRDVLEAVCNR